MTSYREMIEFGELSEAVIHRRQAINRFFDSHRNKLNELLGPSRIVPPYKDQLSYLLGNSIVIDGQVRRIDSPVIDRRTYSIVWGLISEF